MQTPAPPTRPPLSAALSGAELLRWYWLKEELVAFARGNGLSSAGGKQELTARIAAHLDGRPTRAVVGPGARTPAGRQLTAPVRADTVIPPGQRCSQVLRAWFRAELGPGFWFDAAMRDFVAAADGTQTLADALAHWHATRDRGPRQIDPQFELNRFARRWHHEHPGGTHGAMLEAWRRHRSLPVEARTEVEVGTATGGDRGQRRGPG